MCVSSWNVFAFFPARNQENFQACNKQGKWTQKCFLRMVRSEEAGLEMS